MAINYWLGGASGNEGDFETVANWSTGAFPVDGDTIIFSDKAGTASGSVAYHTNGNHWNLIGDLDRHVDDDTDFVKIIITPEFTGNIGLGYDTPADETSALLCSAGEINCQGQGTYYLTCKENSGPKDFDLVILDTTNGTLNIGKSDVDGGACTEAINVKGTLVFLDAIASNLAPPEVPKVTNIESGATTTIHKDNSGGTPDLFCRGGTMYCDSVFTLAEVSGGTFVAGRAGFVPAASVTLAEIKQYGGIVQWRVESTLQLLTIYSGTCTAYGAEAKTLGNSNVINIHGGTLDLGSEQIASVTLGATNVTVADGATFITPTTAITAWSP